MDSEVVEIPPEVQGLTQEALLTWLRHNPVGKAVCRFLQDRRALLRQEHLVRWEQGIPLPSGETEDECRGRCLEIADFLDLDISAIQIFYGVLPEEPQLEL